MRLIDEVLSFYLQDLLWDHYLALCMLALYPRMELMLMNANPVTGIVLH